MGWGGRRRGAGKKRDAAKQVARVTGEQQAAQFLEEIDWQADLKNIYANCGDADTKVRIILAMQARAWGKIDPKGKKSELNGDTSTASSTERLEQLFADAIRRRNQAASRSERTN